MKKYFLYIFVIIAVFVLEVQGDSQRILNLLGQGKFDELRAMQGTVQGVEERFLTALFESDGEKAAEIYRDIWDNHRDNMLAYEALARLWEYHYAIGEYKTASGLEVFLGERPPESIPSETPIYEYGGRYWLQTGAFSDEGNAENQMKQLQEMGFPVKVEQKQSGGQILNLVRVGGFVKQEQAGEAKILIEDRLGIQTQLVEE